MDAELIYKTELHIWVDSASEFEYIRDRLRRGLKKYPGDCGIILFSRDSREYMELPECQFDYKKLELAEAIVHTFGNFNVDAAIRISCRPA